MILVILGVGIALAILGIMLTDADCDDCWLAITSIGVIIFVCALIPTICIGNNVIKLRVIDDKITMYEEENARIEEQIAAVVEGYQVHESELFSEVAPDSAITLVALYPELKSDALVQSQMDIYVANNERIKELRETKINGNIYRCWSFSFFKSGLLVIYIWPWTVLLKKLKKI